MITRDQALTAQHFHYGDCQKIVGPRGGVQFKVERWRRNGRTQTWKTRPDDFRIPVKFGVKDYGQITSAYADRFHVASDCPVEELRAY